MFTVLFLVFQLLLMIYKYVAKKIISGNIDVITDVWNNSIIFTFEIVCLKLHCGISLPLHVLQKDPNRKGLRKTNHEMIMEILLHLFANLNNTKSHSALGGHFRLYQHRFFENQFCQFFCHTTLVYSHASKNNTKLNWTCR